jgi:hypothetical protein
VGVSNAEGLEPTLKTTVLEDKGLPVLVKETFVLVLALELAFASQNERLSDWESLLVQGCQAAEVNEVPGIHEVSRLELVQPVSLGCIEHERQLELGG